MNSQVFYTLLTVILAMIVYVFLMPAPVRYRGGPSIFGRFTKRALRAFRQDWARNGELGGYVHDTAMSLWIPPNCMFGDTATWAVAAGTTTGTIVYGCDATAETANLYVPIPVPANSVDGKGSYLKSLEIDYLVKTAACTSVTASLAKIAMDVDGGVPVVSAITVTQDLTAATDAADADDHKLTVTITTPFWVDHEAHYLLKVAFVKAATTLVEVHGVTANYTARL